MSNTTPEIEIVGQTTEHTTGPYGEPGCDETMHIIIDGEDVYVPFTNVKLGGYDYYGDVPHMFDVDSILLYDGNIHAEAHVENGVVELTPDYNTSTGEFRGHGRWELHFFDEDSESNGIVIYERE